jgi:PAS domain S-box-containing protein
MAFASLRIRILIFLTLLFVFVMGTAGYHAHMERRRDLADAMTRVQERAASIAEKQAEVVNDLQHYLSLLLFTQDLTNFSRTTRCPLLLAHLVKDDRRLANIAFAGPTGQIICDGTPTPSPINIADRAYFQKALKTSDVVIERAIVGRSSGKWSLPFAQSVRDDVGRVQGVLTATLDLQWVQDEFGKIGLGEGGRIGLIDSAGTVLVRHPDPERTVGQNRAETPFFRTLLAHGGNGVAEAVGFDDAPRVYGFANFAETSAGPIYLWIGISKHSVTAAANQGFASDMTLALALALVSFGVIWIGGERFYIQPIGTMVDTARKLGLGKYDARTGLGQSAGELGRLAHAIDEMAIALTSQSDLLRLNRALTVLSECNQALIHAQNEQGLLDDICRIIVDSGLYSLAWVGFADQDEGRRVRPVARYGADDGYLASANISWADNERGRGPTGTAIRTGTPQINQELSRNPQFAPWYGDAQLRGFESNVALPLSDRSRVFGALTIYSRARNAFNDAELKLLQELASDLSFGIATLRDRILVAQSHAAIERSERKFRELIEQGTDLVLVVGRDGSIRYVSPSFERLVGLPSSQLIGQSYREYLRNEDATAATAGIAEVLARPEHVHATQFRVLDQNRNWRIFDSAVRNALANPIIDGIVLNARDVTEHQQMEEKLGESEEQYRTLVSAMVEGVTLQDERTVILAHNRGAERILGLTSDQLDGKTSFDPDWRSIHEDGSPFPGESHPVTVALETGLPQTDVIMGVHKPDGTLTWISINVQPIFKGGQTKPYRAVATMHDVTEYKRSQEALRESAARIERAMLGTVGAVSRMMDMRDPYTSGHERRVGEISAAIAAEMGLDADVQRGLRVAGGVHDVGKITVPAEILTKPTKLSAVEFDMVKTHAAQGFEVLKDIDFPWPVAEVARQHHERLDGSGYPRGLKGDEIILEGRILAVADTVEAMASHRPYRPGLGIEAALSEIEKARGRLYDQQAVDACLRLFRERGYRLPA